jgi:hypothetical protein
VERPIVRRDAIERSAGQLDGGNLAALEEGREIGNGKR